MGQIQSKPIYIFVTYGLASLQVTSLSFSFDLICPSRIAKSEYTSKVRRQFRYSMPIRTLRVWNEPDISSNFILESNYCKKCSNTHGAGWGKNLDKKLIIQGNRYIIQSELLIGKMKGKKISIKLSNSVTLLC